MTDSKLEGPTGPRQSSCLQSPTKKIAQFDAEIGQSKGRRKNFERKQTINRKREAYAAGLAEAGRPRLSSVPKQSLSSPPQAPPTPSNGNRTTAKGKGREELPPAIAKRGRITSPEAEEFSWPSDPGPRPKSSGNVILDGVNIEEWNRQCLLFYLSHRNNKAFNPNSNYSDLKRALGNNPEWASDTDKMGVRDQRQDQGPNMANGDSNVEIDEFYQTTPPQTSSRLCHHSQSATNLFLTKRPAEPKSGYNDANKQHRPEPQSSSMSTSIAPRAAFQPQLGARDLGRALPPAQGSNLPSHSHSINYTKEPGNPLRPFELPHPPSTLVTDRLSQPGNSCPAGPWQGLEQRGPAKASNLGQPLAPTRASSVAPARAFSQAPHPSKRSLGLSTLELTHKICNHKTHPVRLHLVAVLQRAKAVTVPPLRLQLGLDPCLLSTTTVRVQAQGPHFLHVLLLVLRLPPVPVPKPTSNHKLAAVVMILSVLCLPGLSASSFPRLWRHLELVDLSRSQVIWSSKTEPTEIFTGRSHEENEMDDAAEILDTDGPREVGNKRGRLKDFSGTEYKILVWAGRVYKALMLMNDRLVSWCTHAANYVRDKAAAEYFPKTNPMTSNELKAHIEWLKAGGLHTKLQFVVEEREIGKTGKADLEFETQQKAYNTHLTSHGVWLERARPRWALIQKQLFLRGLKFSGSSESTLPMEPKSEEMAELTSKKHKDPEGWGGLDYDEASRQDQLENANKLEQPLVHANKKTLVRKAVLLAPTVKITHIGRIPTTEVTVPTKMRIFAAQSLSTIANASQLWMDIGSATIIVTTGPATATAITVQAIDLTTYITRTRQDRDEYAHFNQIEDCPPNLYRDFGIKPTSGSNYGNDHDKNGDARGTPKRMIETSFGEDYPAEFNGEY
ncbi:hypothetical protein RHS01_06878 [Rhizoctonia solani]|uniref:Uncharacterized protein n=1 Tax=Rhizoctonia solani TaxID=456999 RepID=A0A8H7I9R0_9AGAM|nr:hypothetical protein RHS01_06878 [Rhizoctonia solani]